jgi:predicted Zn-dependent peptidase
VSNKLNPECEWDRSPFAMTSDELDVREAVSALSRLLREPSLPPATLEVVHHALEQLRAHRDSAA